MQIFICTKAGDYYEKKEIGKKKKKSARRGPWYDLAAPRPGGALIVIYIENYQK